MSFLFTLLPKTLAVIVTMMYLSVLLKIGNTTAFKKSDDDPTLSHEGIELEEDVAPCTSYSNALRPEAHL